MVEGIFSNSFLLIYLPSEVILLFRIYIVVRKNKSIATLNDEKSWNIVVYLR